MSDGRPARRDAAGVSVVVPTHGGGDRLRRCLEALRACRPAPGEIIVVADRDPEDEAIARGFMGAGERAAGDHVAEGAGDEARERAGDEARERAGDEAREHAGVHLRIVRLESGEGPSAARNAGAAVATGAVLLFVDGDVVVRPDAVGQVVEAFEARPEWVAVFGSYDDSPADPGFFSRFRNLFHHFTHQDAREEAETFWTGLGAIERDVFLEAGGFDPRQRWLEDIDLGYRLLADGHRIGLRKTLQGTHLKAWTLAGMLRTDVLHRAVPWTRLMARHRRLGGDLNLGWRPRITALLMLGALGGTALAVAGVAPPGATPPGAALAALGCLAALVALNVDLYDRYRRRCGLAFAAAAVPAHWLYLLSCWVGLGLGLVAAAADVVVAAARRVLARGGDTAGARRARGPRPRPRARPRTRPRESSR